MTAVENNMHLERIIQLSLEGKISLFLGAVVSLSSELPTTTMLVNSIKTKFNKAKFRTDDLMDCCQSIIDSDWYDGRKELEKHIRSIFLGKKPSQWHLKLPEYNWRAIFTTNFDDIIEQAYRDGKSPKKDYYPVLTDSFSIEDRSTLYIFKLMGTVLARNNDPGKMVLSNSDYLENVKMRLKSAEVLQDIVQDGTLVFIGYGGDDQFIFHLIDELLKKSGSYAPSKSYMLLKNLSSIEGERQKLSRRGIIPVECSFEKFIELLSNKPKIPKTPINKICTAKIFGYNLCFTSDELKPYTKFFDLLTEEKIDSEPGNKDDFFRGINNSWGAYERDWDFKRTIYTSPNGIKSIVKQELSRQFPRQNKVLLITGMPGIGKTMIVRRLEYDFYLKGIPIVHFNGTKNKFDYKLLDSFLMEFDRKITKASNGKVRNVKSIVIFDDISSLMIDPVELSTYLTSRGRSTLIICSARDINLESNFPYGITEKSIIKVPQRLEHAEISRLVEHLNKLDYLTSEEVWEEFISQQLNNSFFAAMYMLVDPSKRPLGKIIHDQYIEFTDDQKKMFLAISAFHRFNLPINIELLTRFAFNGDYKKFWTVMRDRKFMETVIEYEDVDGNILYITHNPLIAQKTFNLFLSDRILRKDFYCDLFSEVHFGLQKEKELVERVLIRNMGPNRNRSDLNYFQIIEIFLMIVSKSPTKGFLHHLGILYLKIKEFENAEEYLLKALKFKARQIEAYRGESNRNILTSLGSAYLEWAKEKQKLDPEKAEALFKKAEKYLIDAMQGRYRKPHPYHVMARMLLHQGDNNHNSPKKYAFYAQALETIDVAKRNIEKERIRALIEIEIQLFDRLHKDDSIKGAIEILEKDYSSSSGYYVYAKTLMHHGGQDNFVKAMEIVAKGLHSFPADEPLMKVKIEITKELHPSDIKRNFQILDQWYTISKWQDTDLMYDLAVNAFILGYYPTCFKVYRQLERKSVGHKNRFRFSRSFLDEKGEKKLFEGTIVKINNPYEGEIRVDSLPLLEKNIRFRTMTCRNFTPIEGQYVTFYISFNYVSPECVEVHKK